MRVHELTASECERVLTQANLARLACAHDNQPYITPIHVSFDIRRRCLYALSTLGQKVEWMRQNPKVCVEVEDIDDKDHWTTVIAFGRYEEMGESPEDKAARKAAQDLFAGRVEWWLPTAAKIGSQEQHALVLYRIQIERLTGRRAARERGSL